MPLTIVAQITANPGFEATVRRELEKLVPLTREESGCIQYDLHLDNSNPNLFLFFEIWQTRELWQAHMNASHLDDFREGTAGAIADFVLNEMTQIA